jgi:hypothetical protein
MESLFETDYGRAEITHFDINFGLFHIDFGDSFIVEQHFVEFHQSSLQVFVFKLLLGFAKSFENFFLPDSAELIFLTDLKKAQHLHRTWTFGLFPLKDVRQK